VTGRSVRAGTESRPATGRPLPRLARLGVATIAFGLVFDLSEHSFAAAAPVLSGGFSVGEHAAHLVVLIGMVVILLGVIADGVRTSGRMSRPEGSSRDAVR
jgi:hypothetical protein